MKLKKITQYNKYYIKIKCIKLFANVKNKHFWKI